jgi:hypothetical protein
MKNMGASSNYGINGNICRLLKELAYASTLLIVVIGKRMFDRIMPASMRITSKAIMAADQTPSRLTRLFIFNLPHSYLYCKLKYL